MDTFLRSSQESANLLQRIRDIWERARHQAARSVNSAHVCANWLIGREIVEDEQDGIGRAEYGAKLLKQLSRQLTREYGAGFSVSSLQYMRAFYLGYPGLLEKQHAVRVALLASSVDRDGQKQHALGDGLSTGWRPGLLHSALSWTHYRTLLKVDRRDARDFYEIEAVRHSWSARQLERQVTALLFERLAKSRDREGLLALTQQGLTAAKPMDVIKDPYVLEFLELPESARLVETELEAALLNQLQAFLLELGHGFAFVARQPRLTLSGDHFYPDLVFYHIKLKCYVVIDLKTGKLSHADLGQMQMYVHYYDRNIVGPDENPTIGLILCTDKNDAMVRYVLDERNEQIFASRYQLHLPTEEQLRAELQRELAQLDQIEELNASEEN